MNVPIKFWSDVYFQAWGSLTSLTMDPQLKIPPGGLVLSIFMSWKNPSTSAGFEPANLVSRSEHGTPRPPRPTTVRQYLHTWVRLVTHCSPLIHLFFMNVYIYIYIYILVLYVAERTIFKNHMWTELLSPLTVSLPCTKRSKEMLFHLVGVVFYILLPTAPWSITSR